MDEIQPYRQYHYKKPRGLAFDLGFYHASLCPYLGDALRSGSQEDLYLLQVQMDILFNIIAGGVKSFPDQTEPERLKLAREIYRSSRQKAEAFIGSEKHLACLKDWRAAWTRPTDRGPMQEESDADWSRRTEDLRTRLQRIVDFTTVSDLWKRPIWSLLSDFGDAEIDLAFRAGVELRKWHEFVHAFDEAGLDPPELPACFRALVESLRRVVDPSESSLPHDLSDDTCVQDWLASKPLFEVEADLRKTLTSALELPGPMWEAADLPKPYLVVSGKCDAKFLNLPVTQIDFTFPVLRALWDADGHGEVSMKTVMENAKRDPKTIGEYVSRAKRALKRIADAAELPPDNQHMIQKWIDDFGRKTRNTSEKKNQFEEMFLRCIPRADARFS